METRSPPSRAFNDAMRKRGDKNVIHYRPGEELPGLDRKDVDYLFSLAYEELRRLAALVKSDDPAATLNPTALVHEAWLKLARSERLVYTSHLHFKRVAARAMRQLLIESARRRHSRKRGGDGVTQFVQFDDALGQPAAGEDDLLKLDTALEELSRLSPRQALMVECRFFGGLEINETAEILQVSEATITRDWRVAKAWLARELRGGL